MFRSMRSLFRITAVRLSLIYTLIFGIAAVGIIVYMTGATVRVVRVQYEASIDNEVDGLARVYQRGGLNLLFRVLERRAGAPGANLYAVANPQGEIIAGNVPSLDRDVMKRTGWKRTAFFYERYDEENESDRPSRSRAIARVLEVPNGMRILVGRDIAEYEEIGEIVGDAFKLALGTMLALGLITWFFVGRRALKRIDRVTYSSRRILAGDRNERLPITGSNDEFDRLSENLNLMLDRIDMLDDGLKEISDNIAHDLKTPITRLRNKAVDASRSQADLEARNQALNEIISDCDQIVKTFDALLMISRVGSGSKIAELEPVNLVDILADIHELYEAVAEEEGIRFSYDKGNRSSLVVKGNRELLSQAVSNLIDNAIKYAGPVQDNDGDEPEREIILSLAQTPAGAEITVTDNGPGIEEDSLNRVKDRFVRLDKSRNKPGSGLGLSLVDAIAKFHKGRLELANNKPGLRATILLPHQGDTG